jgi:hypothetical protein
VRAVKRPVLALALFAPILVASACPAPKQAPPPPTSTQGTAPLRRLTQEELNFTMRDLFPGVDLPFVALNDGDPSRAVLFDGDVSRQTPSDLAVEQVRTGALAVAQAAVQRKDLLLAGITAGDDKSTGHVFIAQFLPRAFRRPADAREIQAYSAFFDTNIDAHDLDVALVLTMQAALQSPSFLYRIETGGAVSTKARPLSSYEMASRLSYLLWATMPDQTLFDAAAANKLSTPDELEAQARRMLADPRAHDAVLSFHRQWLGLDLVLTTNKDNATFPMWNDTLRQSMRTEVDKMIEEVVFGSGDAKLKTLFTTTKTRVDATLAPIYGVPASAHDWDLVDLPADQRAGIVTNASILAARAHSTFGSPVLRGVFALDRYLCESPPPPPPDVNTNPPDPSDANAPKTNRQRFDQHANNPACAGCHKTIDGIGDGLESYDAIGQFRTLDNGVVVDNSGTVDAVSFAGGPALAKLFANSEKVERCVASHWLTHTRGRLAEPADKAANDDVTAAFKKADGDIKELLVAIVREPSFRTIETTSTGGAP